MTTRRRRVNSGSDQILNDYSAQDSSVDISTEKDIHRIMPRDRTAEFNNAVRSLQGRQIARAVQVKDVKKVKALQSYGEFMLIAKSVGINISNTYAKLEKLTLLAKRKSLFNDRPQEIQELTYIIKEDLNSLNQQIARLQDVAKLQKASQNNSGRKHLLSHESSVVISLQSKLANISNEFKQVLEIRTKNLKHAKSRRDQFSQGSSLAALSDASSLVPRHNSVLMSNNQCAIDMDSTNDQQVQQVTRQTQAMAVYDHSDQYLYTRAETMQNIESTIVELGGIFQQLAHMVKEQEEMVERIDSNVQDAELSIEAAHTQILRYFQSVTSNRWLMIKIFGVLIFFFIFFVVFIS
ncbi:syntaxin-5 [Adelges cooleyi]|uniref:syntaxin-5 n=1 Tax=Adelges cooleyi TaxID=133065 RepID=UPI00217FE585|nr:syntaxin-5 [Adelges cooleyi]XP_050423213.1 syntaxin-5 [Adelges cooleyi]XP_050423214.1 syntaxin-5 [Adelges cooleyi]